MGIGTSVLGGLDTLGLMDGKVAGPVDFLQAGENLFRIHTTDLPNGQMMKVYFSATICEQ